MIPNKVREWQQWRPTKTLVQKKNTEESNKYAQRYAESKGKRRENTGDHGCPEMPIVVGALEDAFGEVWKHISPIISRHYASLRVRLGAPLPGGVVVHGPAGSGKTTLLRAVAQTVHVSEQMERSGRSPPNERSVCLGCTNGRGC